VLNELLGDIGLEVAVMASMWALALFLPFRRMDSPRDLRWDLIAVACGFAFALVAGGALTQLFGHLGQLASHWLAPVASWPILAITVAYVLFADFTSYWAHRLLHSRVLWHTHAFHHSSGNLYVLSGLRSSFVHVAALFAGPLAGLFVFPLYEAPAVLAVITASQVANQHYTHSNIRLPWSRAIERIFVTPRYHFVHHSVDRGLSNSNYGFLLTAWDRLFGTFTDPGTVAVGEPLGLDYEVSKWRMLAGLPPKPVRGEPRALR
jgi:sterol desaturase/sphingolipid hydroxylase (fatty acid hydroxylase superfamily)